MEKQHSYEYDIAVLLPTRGRTVALTRSMMKLESNTGKKIYNRC